MSGRAARGAMAHHGGLAAEEQVAEVYAARGATVLARRWRGGGAEIDLILEEGGAVVFVEVKRAATHAAAAARIAPAQAARLLAAAEAFLGTRPAGTLTESRFDAALVDGAGRVEILRDAFL